MFKALEIGSTIDIEPAHLVAVDRSTNTQSLALGGGSRRPTRAYIVSFYDLGSYRLLVFLGRVDRARDGRPQGLLFRCDPQQVPLSSYEALIREATAMVQSQGFVMERVDFATADAEARASLIAELPFHPDRLILAPPAAARASAPVPTLVPAAPVLEGHSAHADHTARPMQEVSREITLPEADSIARLGRLLTLF